MVNETKARSAYKTAKLFVAAGLDTGLAVQITKVNAGRLLEQAIKSENATFTYDRATMTFFI